MGTLTIRNLDDNVKRELRKRAAERGVSMEQEARDRLAESVAMPKPGKKVSVEEILALGIKPAEPFDQKAFTDELWSYVEQ
jgi:plasmid stability protein